MKKDAALSPLPTRRFSPVLSIGLLAAILGGGSANLGAAQTEPAPEPEAPRVQDEIFVESDLPDIPTSNTVAAKLPLSLLETPASVAVVDAPLFEERRSFVLGDALENVSGMNVQTFNGVFDFFVVRGMDSVSSGLVQTDGVPEPEASFYQLYNVERVEVLKGPAAFLYGDSPLVGTVNLVRKQPQRATFGSFGLSGGSFGTFEGTLDLNTVSQDDKLSFRVNGLWQESDGYRDDKESENLAINPALTWRPSESAFVNLNLEYVETEYSTDAGIPILFGGEVADVPRERSYQSPFDISDQELGRIQVDVEKRFSPRVTLRNKTYYRNLEWLSSGTLFNGAFPTPTGSFELSRFLTSLDNTQTFVGNQLEVLWQAETGSITHNLLAGVEIARRSDEFNFNVFFLPGIDVFNPVEFASEPLFPLPGQATAADATSDVISPYIIDQINFSDRFQLLLGGRFDTIDFDNTVSGITRDTEEFSPMLGAVFAATESLTFYANAGEAFALPSTFVIDDAREPEESQQVEVGAKKSFRRGRIQSSLAAFRIDRENIAIPDDFGIPRQTGDQRSEGFELDLRGSFGNGVRGSFSYAYTDSELTEFTETVLVGFFPPTFATLDRSGNTSPFAPEHLATLWLSKTFDNGIGLAAGGRYVSGQFIAEDNAFEIDDYTTLDASVFYDLASWRLQLSLQNLADEEYITRGGDNGSVIPAPGFGAFGSIRYRL